MEIRLGFKRMIIVTTTFCALFGLSLKKDDIAMLDPAHPGALIRETLEGIREETGKKLIIQDLAEGLALTRKIIKNIRFF